MKARKEVRPLIAVVDDEPDFLLIAESWLKPSCEVISFSRTEGLVEKIRALQPDAVLLDVHMPEEDGFSVCRRLRATPGLEDVPVVYLTGSKTDEDYLENLQSGGTRYLTKPIARRALLEALSELLGTALA